MQVLVTGGAGFIGSHLVNAMLNLGWQVSILDNLSTGNADNVPREVKFYRGDIRDKGFVLNVLEQEHPSLIYHLAAQVSTAASSRDASGDAEINIIGTVNVLEAAVRNNVQKVIYTSSAAVYGFPEYLPIDEKHPLSMLSCYGVSKASAEKYLRVYRHMYGLDYTVLRYANVYGPGQNSGAEGGVVSIFVNRLRQGRQVEIFGDGEQTRDFVYVKDVVAANLAAKDQGSAGTFNVGSDSIITINSLHGKLQELTKTFMPPIYRPARPEDILHSRLENSNARQFLDWQPIYSLDEGLLETVNGWKIKGDDQT